MIASKLLYLHAIFEIFVGVNFIVSPENLMNGYQQRPGYESLAHETFGIACIFWGLLIFLNSTDKTTVFLNVFWNLVWVVMLGTQFMGYPMREQSAVEDPSFMIVPVTAHFVFTIVSLFALTHISVKVEKGKTN